MFVCSVVDLRGSSTFELNHLITLGFDYFAVFKVIIEIAAVGSLSCDLITITSSLTPFKMPMIDRVVRVKTKIKHQDGEMRLQEQYKRNVQI